MNIFYRNDRETCFDNACMSYTSYIHHKYYTHTYTYTHTHTQFCELWMRKYDNTVTMFGQTSVVESDLNPIWNETFPTLVDSNCEAIVIRILDQDPKDNDLLGFVRVNIRDFVKSSSSTDFSCWKRICFAKYKYKSAMLGVTPSLQIRIQILQSALKIAMMGNQSNPIVLTPKGSRKKRKKKKSLVKLASCLERRPKFYLLRDAVPKRFINYLYENVDNVKAKEEINHRSSNNTMSMLCLPMYVSERERVLSQILNEIVHVDMTNLSSGKTISRMILTSFRLILIDMKSPYISLALGMIRNVNVNAKFKGEHHEESSRMILTCHNGLMITLRAPTRVAAEKFEWIATEIQWCLAEREFATVRREDDNNNNNERSKRKSSGAKNGVDEIIGGELVPGSICGAAKSAHDLLSQRNNKFSSSKYYHARKEYERIGAFRQGLWRVSRANHKYTLCETYPSILVVPSKITDKQLHAAASYRSKKRLPVLSYIHAETLAPLVRCSQPLAGLFNSKTPHDRALIEAVRGCSVGSALSGACADMWIIAAQQFREKPYSNGKDARYEAVKAELRAQFGAHAIHNGNKARLKQIAVRCGADIASDIQDTHNRDDHEFPRLQALQIFDCRPKISAQGNAMMGRGTESAASYVIFFSCSLLCPITRFLLLPNYSFARYTYSLTHPLSYENVKVTFLDIGNIHVVRNALDSMCTELSRKSFANAGGWLSSENSLTHTGVWLDTVASVLLGAQRVASALTKGQPCLVHCSDGWDRTSQISALVPLLLDPFYRTRRGFAILIEKEWLRFGHKFKTRSGSSSKSGEIGSIHVSVTGGKRIRRNSGKHDSKSMASQVHFIFVFEFIYTRNQNN